MRNRFGKLGFTLVEVTVATVIVALAVMGITMIVTQTIRGNLENQRTIEATQIAELIIEETLAALRSDDADALTCPGIENGTRTGDSGTEYQTILELTPLRLDLNTGQYAPLTDCTNTDLFQIDVTVAWEGGENVHLSTLTSSDPTYEPHPVFDRFIINGEEHEPQANICAANLPGRINLEWAIYGAATATLQVGDAEPVSVDTIDTRSFDITEDTTFTLTATNGAGITVKEQRFVIVDAVPLVNTFAFNPNPTVEGVPSTLSWSTTDAQAVLLNDEPVTASGTRSIQPIDGTLATLVLTNGACEITQVIDTPLSVDELEILEFQPDRAAVTEGESVTLGWAYNHALSAAHHTATITNSRDSSSVDVTTSSYHEITVGGDTTYTLTITDSSGRVLDEASTEVKTVPPARIDAFDATPAQVCGAQPVNFTWATSNATKLTLMPMGVDVSDQTSASLPLGESSSVYLVAQNEAGHEVESHRIPLTHIPTPVVTFTRDKPDLTQGDALTLTWEVTDAQNITINGQDVNSEGSWTVAPLTTTTYTLVASNEGCESVEHEITVTVNPLEITSVTLTPNEVTRGEESVLTWELNDAFDPELHRFVVEPDGTDVGSDTSLTIPTTAAGDFAYTVVAYDRASGLPLTPEAPAYTSSDRELTRAAPETLTVVEIPVIDEFDIEPLYVCGPAPVTVSWQTRHATSLTINGQTLTPVTNGSAQVNITNATPALILEAKNRLGYPVTSAPISVAYYEIPTGNLTTDESVITAGQTTNLRWNSQHATSIRLDGQTVDASGTLEVTPLETTTYELELVNGPHCEPIRIQHTITVKQVEVDSFTSDHNDITRGQSTTLRWSIDNLDPKLHKVTLHPLELDVTTLSSQVVSPLPPRERYTLTITERNQHARELATSHTVTVVVDEAPTVNTFAADPVAICGVGTTNLTWSTTYATRVMLDNVDVAMNNPFGTEVEIDRERTFTLRAENRLAYPDTAQVTVHHAPQPVVSFAIDKNRIVEGDTITLTWSVVDADRVLLDGESVPLSGSRTLTPREAATYRLVAETDNTLPEYACITPAEVSVEVDPVKIKRFGITTTTEITRGDTLTLPWEMEGPFTPSVHTLTLESMPTGSDSQSVDVTSLTQLDVRPQVDTNYRLTLRGAVGQMLHQSSVKALVLDPPVITRFTATPQEVCESGDVTLAWTATGAAAAFLNGEPLGTPGGGTITRSISGTETFELEVRNSLGYSAHAYQTVTARPAPTATLEADRTSVPMGGEAVITWDVQHADEVLINGQRAEASGSLTITPTSAQTITLAARANDCIVLTREVTVTPQPVNVTDLQAAPASINAGEATTLTWEVSGYHPELHQIVLEPTGQDLIGDSLTLRPNETTTYRASVRLRAGPETILASSNSVTVTVAPEPVIDALRVEPAYVCAPNQALTLTWATRNATSVKLDGQTVSVNGSRQVTGSSFILEAANALGRTVTRTIEPLVAPTRNVTFAASETEITRGQNVTLTWEADGAHTATLDGQSVPLTGSLVVAPEVTTTYRLQTSTSNGAIDCSTTHLVTVEVEYLEIESFTATPTSIAAGGTSTLKWQTSSNLDNETHKLTLQPLGLDVTTLSERAVKPTEPTAYWLELRDVDGRLIQRSERVTVAIQGKPALTRASVTPANQCQAGSVTLTWDSVNAASVLINGTERPAAGSLQQSINATRQFTLTPVDNLGNHGNTETLLARITPRPTVSLTSDKTTIGRGDTITLTWNATGAESVTLDGQHVPASGTRVLKPDATTTYRLEASNGDCITTRAVTINVENVSIDSFASNRDNITPGENITLTWALSGFKPALHTLTLHPTNLELEHDTKSHTLKPDSSTQYLLRVTDENGRVLAERKLEQPVRVHDRPVITGFTADQLLVSGDADVTLRWSTRNATSVTLDGSEVTPKTAGATTRRVTSERTFRLVATNEAGATATATVTIKHAPPPTASLQVTPASITAGDSATLSWAATGEQTLLNGASVPASGSLTVAPTRTSTYTLESRNESGQIATSTVTVAVDPVRITSLTADPTRAQGGDEILLAWETTPTFDSELHTLTLKPGDIDVTTQTRLTLETDTSSTYVLVLTDKSGRELHRTSPGVTVTVDGAGAITSLNATAPTCASNQTVVTWTTRDAARVRLNGQTLDANLTSRGAQTLNPAPGTITLEALNAGGGVIDTRTIDLPQPTAPVIAQFRANRSSALAGQAVKLEWNVTGAARVTIDGVEVNAQGDATLAIHESTTYTLTAESNTGCITTQRVTVDVHHVSVEDLTADKTSIRPGESVNLAWTYGVAPAAEHQVVLEGHGPLARSGSTHPKAHSVTPAATTTYSVAILDSAGRVLARSNPVTIEVQPQPEVVSFHAAPQAVCGAGDVLLTWSTKHATRTLLTINGATRDVTSEYGTTTVRAQPGDELTLTAWTDYAQADRNLTIGGGQRPSISFDVTPAHRVAGQAATVTWNVEGATSVKLNGQTVDASGSLTDTSHTTTAYTLEVAAGDCEPITLERVIRTDSVSAYGLTADRTHITDGDTTTLRWSLSDTFDPQHHNLILEPTGANVTTQHAHDITPSETTAYTLRVTDKAGKTLATSPSVTVTVEGYPAITRFDATPLQVCGVNDVTFNWSTLNASRVLLNGNAVSPLSSGSTKIRITKSGEYVLEAINPLGVRVTSDPITIQQANRPTITFTADKQRITDGDAVELTWSTTDATEVSINGQARATSGTITVHPRSTTTYTLTANNPAAGIVCDTTATVTITVDPVTIQSFTIAPTDVTVGHDYQLAWALSSTFDPKLHTVRVDGGSDLGTAQSLTRKADNSRTHTLAVHRRHDNSLITNRTANVTVHAAPVIDTLSLAPASICTGGQSTLTWATRHANSVTLNAQGVNASGNRTVNPTTTANYQLVATNPAGTSVQRQATLTVHQRPVITFTTTKANIAAGDKATLNWSIQNATSARLNGQTVPLTGSLEVNPLDSTTYTLSVDQADCGTTTRQITINVSPVTIQSLTAHPPVVTIPDTSELRWTLSSNYDPNLHTLQLNRYQPQTNIGTVTGTKHTVTPDAAGTNGYELKLLDKSGRTLATRQVNVTGSRAPTISNLKASPASVCVAPGAAGTAVPITLTWSRGGDWTSALINGSAITATELSNNRAVRNATGTTTFTLEARNQAHAHGSSRGSTTASVSVPFTQVIDPTFTATKTRITAGDSVTLNWAAAGASVTLDGQAVSATGNTVVRPTSTTTYTLTAQTGDCAPITKTITITVDSVSVNTFSADKTNITSSDPVKLTWSLTRYTSSLHKLILEPLGTTVTGTTTTVNPTVTTTYRLRIDDNHGRTLARGPQVTVTAHGAPAIESFNVNRSLVCGPQDVTLSWATANASALRLNGQALTPISNGSTTRRVTGTTTFTLAALNPAGGSVTEARTVTYVDPLQASLSSNKTRMSRGDTATLTWSVAAAKSVTLNGQAVSATGSLEVTPTSTTTYRLVTTSEHCGNITREVTIQVDPVTIDSLTFTAEQDANGSVPAGDPVNLAWTLSNSYQPSIHRLTLNGEDVTNATKSTKTLAQRTTYTLRLYDRASTPNLLASRSVTVVPQPTAAFTQAPAQTCQANSPSYTWAVTHATNVEVTDNAGKHTYLGGTYHAAYNQTKSITATSASDISLAITATNELGSTATATRTISVTPKPELVSFTTSASKPAAGATYTLSWNVTNAPNGTVTLDGQAVNATGTQTVIATNNNASHTLRVTVDPCDPIQQSLTITPQAVSLTSFAANPTTVTIGNNSQITWATNTHYDPTHHRLELAAPGQDEPSSGDAAFDLGASTSLSRRIAKAGAHDYRLTIYSRHNGQQLAQSSAVRVTGVYAPSISSFTATPAQVCSSNPTSSLTWATANATTRTLTGAGNVAASGNRTVTLDSTTTYTLTARNAAGTTVSRTATVQYVPAPQITSFTAEGPSANNRYVTAGKSYTITWGLSDPNATPILDGMPLAAGTTSATRTAPNSPDPINHTLALELGPCATEPVSLTVRPAVAPSAVPAPVAAITGEQQVTLTWQAAAFDGNAPITRYGVYRLTNGGSPTTVYLTNVTTYVDESVLPGNTYKYFVWAGNAAGLWAPYSPYSNDVTVIGVPGVPNPPHIRSVVRRGAWLGWSNPNNGGDPITGYQFERQASSDASTWGAWEPITLGSIQGANNQVAHGLTPGHYYRFRFAAVNGVGVGPMSGASEIMQGEDVPGISGKPVGERQDMTTITWTWDPPTDTGYTPITSYRVYRQVFNPSTGSWTNAGSSVTTTSPELTVTDLTPGEHNRVTVVAINRHGSSNQSPMSDPLWTIGHPDAPDLEIVGFTPPTREVSNFDVLVTPPANDGGAPIDRIEGHVRMLTNLAPGATVTGTTVTNPHLVNDGDKTASSGPYSHLSSAPSPGGSTGAESRYYQLDLGSTHTVAGASIYFYAHDSRHYWYKVKVSTDGANWTYIAGNASNSGWVQSPTSTGWDAQFPTHAVAPALVEARYVRVYINGNSANLGNHLDEIEVWGFPTTGGPSAPIWQGPEGGTQIISGFISPLGPWAIAQALAYNTSGYGSALAYSKAAPTYALASQPSLAATYGNNTITLSWGRTYNGNSPIQGFRVERQTNGSSTWTTLAASHQGLSFTDTGSPGTQYRYRVAAINEGGIDGLYGYAYTGWLSFRTTPNTPSAPSVTVSGNRSLRISWSAPGNGGSAITGYAIQYRAGSSILNMGGWTTLTTNTGSTSTSYTHTGLTAGTYYQYRVAARNAVGVGSYSSGTSTVRAATVPGQPGRPTVTRSGNQQLSVSWTAATDGYTTGGFTYALQRSTNGGSWVTIATLSGRASTTYTDRTAYGGSSYRYRVMASNSVGSGGFSPISITVRPYYYRGIEARFRWSGFWCSYTVNDYDAVYGNNAWSSRRYTNGGGCSMWADTGLRWDATVANPSPVCQMLASNQSGSWAVQLCNFTY